MLDKVPTVPEHDRKSFPHGFRRVRLELAREKGHPEGSAQDGYILILPLDPLGRIDLDAWHAHRDLCRIVKFREGEDDEIGRLQRKSGGSWAFHYEGEGVGEDERVRHLESEQFIVGEYVSIREEDRLHTFQVASVDYI
jgi:hypothetical protein